MVVETRKPMQCPDCGENVMLIQIEDYNVFEMIECIVDPEPLESSTFWNTEFQEHRCKEGDLEWS